MLPWWTACRRLGKIVLVVERVIAVAYVAVPSGSSPLIPPVASTGAGFPLGMGNTPR